MTPFDLINTERYKDSPFSVPCPHCGSVASYRADQTRFFSRHDSQVAVELAGSEPDNYVGTVFGECQCNNRECQEYVHFVGSYVTERDESTDPAEYAQKFLIRFFFPAVPLIKIPSNTPEEVSLWLKRSFAPAFNDQSASGHLLRTAIEHLLTKLNVPRFIASKGKRIRLSLHARIERLPAEVQVHKDQLLAIKWIGNSASHDDLHVHHLRLLYEIIEDVLEKLYGTRARDLLREIKRINRRKRP